MMIDKLMTDRSSRITLIDNITEVVMKPREIGKLYARIPGVKINSLADDYPT
jgi:hypothetical protein